jgi:xylulokinase
MAELLLGIDVGTYSSKGVLVSPEGGVLRSQVFPHTMDVPRPGWAEQDADAVWWNDTVKLCRGLLDGSPYSGADVAGVAVSAIGPCLLPLDEEGRPLRKGILYGVDGRAEEEIGLLNDRLGEENVYRFSNMTFTSQAIGPKILWLKRREPEVWRRTRRLTTASSYLVFRLTGEYVIDRHTAGHYMPLMDPTNGEWSDRFAEHIAPLEMLPRLAWSDAKAGEVNAAGAAQTGLKAGTPVAVGAVDALSEAISVGAVEPGDLMVMYGSTAFFILVGEKPVPDRRTWSVPGAFEGQYNLAAGMATTGSLTRWFRDELARDLPEKDAYAALFQSAARVPPGSGGLLMLPYFSGERTPINDARARGVIAGLSLSHGREHLFRAVLESVAFGIRHNLETFLEMGASIRRIVAVGGGAQSDTWLRIVSDVAGVSQVLPRQTIGASYGDAFLAGRAAGLLEPGDLDGWIQVRETIEPDAARRALYEPFYRDFLELYRQTREIVHRLGRRAKGD